MRKYTQITVDFQESDTTNAEIEYLVEQIAQLCPVNTEVYAQ